jgi:SAM-dependent methyltransferase
MSSAILSYVRSNPQLKERLRSYLGAVGYDATDWVRVVMYRRCFEFIRSLGPERLDVLEISAGPQWVRDLKFGSYTTADFPDFDICAERLPRQFDLIIADQVFEHLRFPHRAGKNVYAMLRPGGHFVIATPFLIRVHESPIDCSRWTEDGLSYLLQECGFEAERITTGAWGNRACVVGNLTQWRKRGMFRSLENDANLPVMVWAFAQRTPEPGADA